MLKGLEFFVWGSFPARGIYEPISRGKDSTTALRFLSVSGCVVCPLFPLATMLFLVAGKELPIPIGGTEHEVEILVPVPQDSDALVPSGNLTGPSEPFIRGLMLGT